ncbi:MAG: hypothetical protein ABI047_16055 [Jatrophihabitantaceae bacterium]
MPHVLPPPDLDSLETFIQRYPARFGIWRYGPNAAPALLTALSILRIKQWNAHGSGADAHAKWIEESWCETAATLLDWCARFSEDRRRVNRITPQKHDVLSVISHAHLWQGLQEKLIAAYAGTDVYEPYGDTARFRTDRNRHRWDVQALQFRMDATARLSPRIHFPERDRRIADLGKELDRAHWGGLREERAGTLTAELGRHLASSYAPTLSGEHNLGGYTLAEGLALLGQLTAYAYVGDRLLTLTDDSKFALIGGPRAVLERQPALGAGTSASVTAAFVDSLVYRTGDRVSGRLAAALERDGMVQMPAALLLGAQAENRMLRLLAGRDPSLYGAIGRARGKGSQRFTGCLSKMPGALVAHDVKVLDSGGRVLTDVDAIAIDPATSTGLTIQVKCPIETETTRGRMKMEAELRKGIAQSDTVAKAMAIGSRLKLPPAWPTLEGIRWSHFVGTPDTLPTSSDLWMHTARPISAQLVEEIAAPSVQVLCEQLKEPVLPVEEFDWVVRPYRTHSGVLPIESDGQHTRWHSHNTEVPTLARRGVPQTSVIVPCPWAGDHAEQAGMPSASALSSIAIDSDAVRY